MQTIPIEDIIKIQPKGVITIPKKARLAAGLTDNSLARVRVDRGRLFIEPVTTLPYPVRQYTDKEIDEFFAFDDQQTRELRKKGIIK